MSVANRLFTPKDEDGPWTPIEERTVPAEPSSSASQNRRGAFKCDRCAEATAHGLLECPECKRRIVPSLTAEPASIREQDVLQPADRRQEPASRSSKETKMIASGLLWGLVGAMIGYFFFGPFTMVPFFMAGGLGGMMQVVFFG